MLQSESKPAIIALPFFKTHNNSYNMFLKIFQHFFKAIQNPTNFICPRYFSPLSLLAFVYENNVLLLPECYDFNKLGINLQYIRIS